MREIIKAVVIKMDIFESQIVNEKNFSIDEESVAQTWLSQFDHDKYICVCCKIHNNICI